MVGLICCGKSGLTCFAPRVEALTLLAAAVSDSRLHKLSINLLWSCGSPSPCDDGKSAPGIGIKSATRGSVRSDHTSRSLMDLLLHAEVTVNGSDSVQYQRPITTTFSLRKTMSILTLRESLRARLDPGTVRPK